MDAKEEVIHREFYARSRDIIRVYNPLTTDFRFKFDSIWYKVPAKGTKDFERYLAGKFFHDISEYIIGQMMIEKGNAMIEEREKKGLAPFLNKYDENRAIWDNTPRMDNKELLEHVADEVILGLVEQFGSETGPEDVASPRPRNDINTPLGDQIMNAAAKKTAFDTPLEEKPVIAPAFDKPKEDLKTEVTVIESAPVSNEYSDANLKAKAGSVNTKKK